MPQRDITLSVVSHAQNALVNRLLEENQSAFIPIGMKNRLANPGAAPLFIVEVQSGRTLGEDDIQRFEDRYKRS